MQPAQMRLHLLHPLTRLQVAGLLIEMSHSKPHVILECMTQPYWCCSAENLRTNS